MHIKYRNLHFTSKVGPCLRFGFELGLGEGQGWGYSVWARSWVVCSACKSPLNSCSMCVLRERER